MTDTWYAAENIETVDSPALLFYPKRIEHNIRRTIEIAGGTATLRPHVKTHKCPRVVHMQADAGITKFKCATIAEAEMSVLAGARDVLLAYQPVGPSAWRYSFLETMYGHETRFACIADDAHAIKQLAHCNHPNLHPYRVFLDIDCGQGRTGVRPGEDAFELYKLICSDNRLVAAGLHVYDGHIHDIDIDERKRNCNEAFAPVEAFRRRLIDAGMNVPTIVTGGTPTFPIHAKRAADLNIECSPGTNVLWDAGYSKICPDLDFIPAATVLTRVVSKPAGVNRLCLDLGHKSIASEGPHPRVIFPQLVECRVIMHNEEHLVVEAANASAFKVGDPLYGIPWHICPTVALHCEAAVILGGCVTVRWPITARDRKISI
ncbi:MAG: D-TA family PLP-dependent enzyme [Planctomycetota bacterium]